MTEHVHFIGIGGSGLSAIARLMVESGYLVTGSDRVLSPLARDLMQAGIHVFEGHQAGNIAGADLVVRSSAIPDDNPEVIAAKAAGIPVLKRSDIMMRLLADKNTFAIAGTHGKTTTTAMLAWAFTDLGLSPSFIIGGVSKNLGANARAGKGKVFVIEADEYDRMFMGLHPAFIILTSVEHDHPDCYPTMADYMQAFQAFVGQLRKNGTLLVCRDDEKSYELRNAAAEGCAVVTYGVSAEADFRANNLRVNSSGGYSFIVSRRQTKEALAVVDLQVPGEHNVRNALAVLAATALSGLSVEKAAQALSRFQGTGRRFDLIGEAMGVTVIDDYAHHPTEISMTLQAARTRYPDRRIWAVWQPHTYSRTRSLMAAYAQAFSAADRVIVTEVYAAREKNTGFSSRVVAGAMVQPAGLFIPNLADVTAHLLENLKPGDVLLVLSAGDADSVSAGVLAGLKEREAVHD